MRAFILTIFVTLVMALSATAQFSGGIPGGGLSGGVYGDRHWKAPVANVAALPLLGNITGDTRIETAAFGIYTWTGAAWQTGSSGVTAITIATANGFAGSSSGGATPALTLSTTITGLVKGNGTAISVAASGTDYQAPISNFTCSANQWVNQWTAPNTFTCAQPAFSNLSGTATIAQGGTNSGTALNNNRVIESIGGALVEAAAITANRALVSNASGLPIASSVTDTTLAFLDATSSVQTQLNARELLTNKSTDGTMAANSTTLYPSQSAVVTYVAAQVGQLNPLDSAKAASTANIPATYTNAVSGICIGDTLQITATTAFVIDGYTGQVGDRILFKDQSSTFQDGVWTLTTLANVGVLGALFTRALDSDSSADWNAGQIIPIINGTANAATSWYQTATNTTCNTSTQTWTQFQRAFSAYALRATDTFTGVHDFPSGSSGLPSIAITGSLTTGLFSAASNAISIATNAVEAIRVLSDQTLRFFAYGTGILHSSSTGVVTSSTVVDADVNAAAAIALTKLGTLSGYAAAAGTVASGDSVQTAIAKLDGNIAAGSTPAPVVQVKGANYTALSTDDVIVMTAAVTGTLTLPDCTGLASNHIWKVKNGNTGASTVTVQAGPAFGSNKFDSTSGDSVLVLSDPGVAVEIICNKGSVLYVF